MIDSTSHEVVNVDKLTYAGNISSVASVSISERYIFEHADICDGALVADVFARHQPDAVMHLAAESHVDGRLTVQTSSSKPMLWVLITCSRQRRRIGRRWTSPGKWLSAFIIFLLMRSMIRRTWLFREDRPTHQAPLFRFESRIRSPC